MNSKRIFQDLPRGAYKQPVRGDLECPNTTCWKVLVGVDCARHPVLYPAGGEKLQVRLTQFETKQLKAGAGESETVRETTDCHVGE